MRAEVYVRRDVDLHPPPVAQYRSGPLEEADPVHGKGPLVTRRGVVRHERHHVVFGNFEQPLRRGQDPPRRSLTPVRAYEDEVRAAPRAVEATSRVSAASQEALPRRGEVKAAGRRVHEAAGFDVELAVTVRVAAVGGERQQGPPVGRALGRAQETGTVEDPLLALRRGQRVHIQQEVPLRDPPR